MWEMENATYKSHEGGTSPPLASRYDVIGLATRSDTDSRQLNRAKTYIAGFIRCLTNKLLEFCQECHRRGTRYCWSLVPRSADPRRMSREKPRYM